MQPAEDLRRAQELVSALHALAVGGGERRHYLLVVNPRSGPHRNAEEIACNEVVPMLEQAGITLEICVTDRDGHATELFRGRSDSLSTDFDAVIVMGGDGIVHEVLNGLRPGASSSDGDNNNNNDDDLLQKLPVGVIGCGTANGLASSLSHASGEPTSDVLSNAFLIAKGKTLDADLSEYTTTDNNKKYTSFLTFTWAIIADIDIESERIHWMGATRFDVWAVWAVLRYRSYRATFRYSTTNDVDPSKWTSIEDDFVYFMASQVTHVS